MPSFKFKALFTLVLALGVLTFLIAAFLPRSETDSSLPLSLFVARVDSFVPSPFAKSATQKAARRYVVRMKPGARAFPKEKARTAFRFALATYMKGPYVGDFTLEAFDERGSALASPCRWEARRATASDNGWVTLAQVGPKEGHPASCAFEKVAHYELAFVPSQGTGTEEVSLALWTREQWPALHAHALLMSAADGTTYRPVMGYFQAHEKHVLTSRAHLLARMWGLPFGLTAGLLIASAGLIFAGAFTSVFANYAAFTRARFFVATLLLLAGAASLLAVAIPPLHGPDEPNHLLSYAVRPSAPLTREDVLEVARRGHFRDIRSQDLARFSVENASSATTEEWQPFIDAYNAPARSPVMTVAWDRLFTPTLQWLGLTEVTFALRAMSVALFIACAALGLHLCAWPAGVPFVGGIVLLSPMVPFAASNFSNYVLVPSLALAFSTGFLAFFGVTPREPMNGMPGPAPRPARSVGEGALFGLVCALCFHTTVAFVPLLILLPLGALLLEPFSPQPEQTVSGAKVLKAKLLRLGAFALMAPVVELLLTSSLPLVDYTVNFSRPLAALVPDSVFATAAPFPWSLAAGAFAVGNAIVLGTTALLRDRVRLPVPARVGRRAQEALLVATILVVPLLGTLAFGKTVVPNIEDSAKTLDALTYSRRVVQHFFSQTGVWTPSWYSQSLWGLFGAVDRALPLGIVRLLQAASWAGFTFGCWRLARARPTLSGRLACVALFYLALALPLALLAFGNYTRSVNLHGRYTFGPHIFMLVVTGLGLYEWFSRRGTTAPGFSSARTLLLGVAACAQLFLAAWLLTRYID